jgi:hypothetical protein
MSIIQTLIGSIVSSTSGGGGGGGGGGNTYNSWTVEWFQKSNSTQPSTFPRVFGVNSYPSQPIGFSLEGVYYGWKGGQGFNTNQSVTHNVWQHWVMVTDGINCSIYKDGVRTNYFAVDGTTPVTNPSVESYLYLGIDSDPANGYKGLITNFRIVKGQAMYDPTSSSIPVPAVPLTSNANTQLLLTAFDAGSLTQDTSAYGRIPAGDGNITYSADTPFTAAGPYTALYPVSDVNVLYILKTSYPDIANVRAGWSATADDFSGTVTNITATDPLYYILTINVASGSFGGALVTFTQPPLGGSIEFYTGSYGYIRYDAGTQWALDVV